MQAANKPRKHAREQPSPWWRRLAWFVALWVMGVAAVGAVAMLLRWLLKPIAS